MRNVTLILDDGSRFHGKSFGYEKPVAGEVVFNTAMTGANVSVPQYFSRPGMDISEVGLPSFVWP